MFFILQGTVNFGFKFLTQPVSFKVPNFYPILIINLVLLKFQEKHGRNPQGSTSKEDVEDLLKLRDGVFESLKISRELVPDEFARY